MVTLIELRNKSGIIGRCDAACYNSELPHCRCVCGGRNHGVGLERALENGDEQMRAELTNKLQDGETIAMNKIPIQLTLPFDQ